MTCQHETLTCSLTLTTSLISMRKFRKPITVGGEKVFPPEKEYNHISPSSFGPLKTDWNTRCPSSLSEGQKRERCVSVQEAVWGKAVLTRLENIKKKVDPKGVFKCHRCVGGNDPPKYSWDVTYPSCKRGYWHSGCGQPAMKQKGTVKCSGKGPDTVWEADAKYCTGKKPVAERVCPATKPCREFSFTSCIHTPSLASLSGCPFIRKPHSHYVSPVQGVQTQRCVLEHMRQKGRPVLGVLLSRRPLGRVL